MNERIKELAEQAEMSANKGDHVDVKIMMEKFAQLIILDCLEICKQREQANLYGVKEALATIRERFEVEL